MDGGFVLRNTVFADWQCAQLPFLSEMGKRSGNAIVSLVLLHQFLHFGLEVMLEVLVRLVGFPAQAPGSVRDLLREISSAPLLVFWLLGSNQGRRRRRRRRRAAGLESKTKLCQEQMLHRPHHLPAASFRLILLTSSRLADAKRE